MSAIYTQFYKHEICPLQHIRMEMKLHTQPTSVQSHTLQSYVHGSSTFHPSASNRTDLAQHGQKSTCSGPKIIFFQQSPEQLILSKTYPTSGYNLSHISRYAKLLAGCLFCKKTTKEIPYFQYFSSRFYTN